MRVIALAIFGAALAFPPVSSAQGLKESVEPCVQANQKEILSNLMAALEFPAVAADKATIRRKAEFQRDQLTKRRLVSEILETDGNPLVFGKLIIPGSARTLLLYCHYDGQPVQPGPRTTRPGVAPVCSLS